MEKKINDIRYIEHFNDQNRNKNNRHTEIKKII